MPLTKITFCHDPSENVEKVNENTKRITVRGRINRNWFADLKVGDQVDWDGYVFMVSYVGVSVNAGFLTCDIEIVAVVPHNACPLNADAIKKIKDEEKEAKAMKLAQLKAKAKERRRIKKEEEQRLIEGAQSKQQSTIGSLEL